MHYIVTKRIVGFFISVLIFLIHFQYRVALPSFLREYKTNFVIVFVYIFFLGFFLFLLRNDKCKKVFLQLLPLFLYYLYTTLRIGITLYSDGIESNIAFNNLFNVMLSFIFTGALMLLIMQYDYSINDIFFFFPYVLIFSTLIYASIFFLGYIPEITAALFIEKKARIIDTAGSQVSILEGNIYPMFGGIFTLSYFCLLYSMAIYNKSKKLAVFIFFLHLIGIIIMLRKSALILAPILFIAFAIFNKLPIKNIIKFLLVVCVIIIVFAIFANVIFNIDIIGKWIERISLSSLSSIEARKMISYTVMQTLFSYENYFALLFGGNYSSFYTDRFSNNRFAFSEPTFITQIGYCGILSFIFFLFIHLKWLLKIISNFKYIKSKATLLFSTYLFIYVTLTLPLYHYTIACDIKDVFIYLMGYIISFIHIITDNKGES